MHDTISKNFLKFMSMIIHICSVIFLSSEVNWVISLQAKLYNEKRSDLEEQQLHLNIGLQKIKETVEQVEELQKSLSVKRLELEDKNAAANAKLKQMVRTLALLISLESYSGEGLRKNGRKINVFW